MMEKIETISNFWVKHFVNEFPRPFIAEPCERYVFAFLFVLEHTKYENNALERENLNTLTLLVK